MPVSYRINNDRAEDDHVRVLAISDRPYKHPYNDPDSESLPFSEITVSRPQEISNFETTRESSPHLGVHGYTDVYRPSRAFREHSGRMLATPDELFTHIPPQVSYAFSDPTLRQHIPTMIGMAMRAAGSPHETPMADSSLTKFSSALSRKAVSMGLAQPHPYNPDMESTNEAYDHMTLPPRQVVSSHLIDGVFPDYSPVPPEEVAESRKWVRSRLSESRAKRGESQFSDVDPPDEESESKQEWRKSAVRPGLGQTSLEF